MGPLLLLLAAGLPPEVVDVVASTAGGGESRRPRADDVEVEKRLALASVFRMKTGLYREGMAPCVIDT